MEGGLFPTRGLDGATREVEAERVHNCASGCRAGKKGSSLSQFIGRGWMVSPLVITHLKGGDRILQTSPARGEGLGTAQQWRQEFISLEGRRHRGSTDAGDGQAELALALQDTPPRPLGLGMGFPPPRLSSNTQSLPLTPESCWSRIQLPKCRCLVLLQDLRQQHGAGI